MQVDETDLKNIYVYNTLSKQKEEFTPITPGEVKMYVCGVTPYNHSHIGNARPFVTWDVIHRYLEYRGYQVTHIQNFTDVDDKIINASKLAGVQWSDIADQFIVTYFEVMDALHIRRVDRYPRVSEHMDDIIRMIEGLIAKGYAYPLHGDVYYDISTFAPYGKLSGRNVEDMLAGARVAVDDEKRNPGDFALWKAAKPDEPSWDSPWGKGRPGWHIECSAMSTKYLGDTFDFHGGGSDLIFPHHENEIAQSEGCTGHAFVNYWLHNGFITIDQEKMSKSLGNFFLVKDILAKYSPDALRFFLISTHYRSPLDFSDERLEEAERTVARLAATVAKLRQAVNRGHREEDFTAQELRTAAIEARHAFIAAMNDDFNTALAIGAMFTLVKNTNIYLAGNNGEDARALNTVLDVLHEMMDVLGILPQIWEEPEVDENEFKELLEMLVGVRQQAINEDLPELAQEMTERFDALGVALEAEPPQHAPEARYQAVMQSVLALREQARAEKKYQFADLLRDRLAAIGIVVEDGPEGSTWNRREI